MAICVDIVPTPCGGTNKLTMKDACNDVHFTGIEDTTINQGVGIDLTEGIHAYDGNGNEIEYTVTPDSIDKCDVGEHTVVYRTIGEGDKFLPSFCMDNVDVTLGDTFCNEILLEEDRIVTITQADPPTIEGIETIPTIYPNEEFDPTEGITATDDNGKTIDFTYSGRVEDSSEGAIASFETEFEQDALSVVADIEPVQSFNGYDKPWVGGSGKNKFYNTSYVTSAGVTYVVGDDASEVIVSGTSTGQSDFYLWNATTRPFYLPSGEYTISVSGLQGDMRLIYSGSGNNGVPYYELKLADNNTKRKFTVTDGTKPFNYFVLRASSGQTFDTTIKIQIESGDTATDWTPYSNICPISGHDEVNVWNDPKYGGTIEWNQLLKNANFASGMQNWNTGPNATASVSNGVLTAVANSTPTGNQYVTQGGLAIPSGHKILWSAEIASNNTQIVVQGVKLSPWTNVFTQRVSVTSTLTPKAGVVAVGSGNTVNGFLFNFDQKENIIIKLPQFFDLTQMFGSTIADYIYSLEQATAGAGVAWFKNLFPKDFYAYNSGETTCVSAVNGDPYKHYTTDLERTVYGGTVDVVSGVLTVDRASVDMGSLTWTYFNSFFRTDGITATVKCPPNNQTKVSAISSAYPIMTWTAISGTDTAIAVDATGKMIVANPNITSLSDFQTAISGVQLCYELATPQTYQLTPQQIDLLLGQNNVWADTGDIKVIYEKEMPASGNIEYLTAGLKIITYTATDECGNQTVEQRIVYVLGDTPQVCMAEVCTAHVACEDNQ